jgi:HEAT repeat protein
MDKKEYALYKLNQFRGVVGQDFRNLNVQRVYSETIDSLISLPETETEFLVKLLKVEYDKACKGESSILICGPICLALAEYKESKAVPILGRILVDPISEPIREDVAEILGELGDPLAMPFLIQILSDKIIEIRAKAARSLGMIGDRKAVQSLMALLDDESEIVREHAISALAELKAVEASFAIIKILQNDEDAYVRAEAARALGELGVKAATETLKGITEREADNHLVDEAKKALERL